MQLIADSTAGFLFRQGRVDAVIVGADRIARNGDVVNKIGTYGLAVLAAHHGIPFYVAAPTSTIDLKAETGHTIPIEERSPSELTEWDGRRLAPAGVAAYAPAFDLTPAELVTALVTEHGVMRSPSAEALSALPMSGGNTT
jgi:methylthioribose-1-phosphate isomerase